MRSAAGRAITLALAPPLTASLMRLTWATARVTVIGRERARPVLERPEPFVLAFWHCQLFLMQYALAGRPVTALISRHGDGELIARTMARFGHAAARGSSTRGGAIALREALRIARSGGALAVTPDGPRGPAREVKPGVIELARAAGIPILPCALASRPCLRLRSWDRFEVPAPFGRVAIAYGETVSVARGASDRERADAAVALQSTLENLSRVASSAVAPG